MDFQQLLRFAAANNASDVHLQSGMRASLRIGGIIRATDQPPLTEEEVRNFIRDIAPPRFRDNTEERMIPGLDFSYAVPGLTRFRCSAYRHLGQSGIAMRIIRNKIPSIGELHLPQV